MLPGAAASAIRAAAIIPAALLVLFAGLLWLLGLPCGKDRRDYVITLSQQAMDAVGMLLHGSQGTRSQTPLPQDTQHKAASEGDGQALPGPLAP